MPADRQIVHCTTQAKLDAALASQEPCDIWLVGTGTFRIYDSAQVSASDSAQVRASDSAQVRASDSAQVRAYDSAQVRAYHSAQVTALDSAQVRAYDSAQVRAYGSAQVRASGSAQVTVSDFAHVTVSDFAHVTAYGSAHVTAYGSAQVRAYGSAQVTAYHSAHVTASKFVAVTKRGRSTKVDGGVQIDLPPIRTAAEWCEFYGVTVNDGIVTLYKGVNADYHSSRGGDYTPGTCPIAPDWDGGVEEYGGGLHFSPRPVLTLRYHDGATKFVACGVRLEDIAVHEDASCPDKVKARAVTVPCVEVDIDGNQIPEVADAS